MGIEMMKTTHDLFIILVITTLALDRYFRIQAVSGRIAFLSGISSV